MQNADSSGPRAEPTKWLDQDERQAWLAVASIIFTLPAALDARLQKDADLTFFDYMVLSVLSEQDDLTMQMSDIARGVSASLSRLSHVATKLEKQGYLTRARVHGSGRRTSATLTEAGHEKVVAAAPDHVTAVRAYLIDALTPDDLSLLARIGPAVARRIDPTRPVIYDQHSGEMV